MFKIFFSNAFLRLDPQESHRTATMLELLYDLIIVIGMANTSHCLYHYLIADHYYQGALLFSMTFFTLWWIWMNFTWFATVYYNDDSLYRLLVFVQIIGAMIFAASIEKIFKEMDFSYAFWGFMLIRISFCVLWVRVMLSYDSIHKQAIGKIIGIIVCQFGWYVLTFHSSVDNFISYFIAMVIFELCIPVFIRYLPSDISSAQWDNHHIIERYALFTIIALGECFVVAVNLVKITIDSDFDNRNIFICLNIFCIIFSLWWLYFSEKDHYAVKKRSTIFQWGYIHFLIFISLTSFGPISLLLTENYNIASVFISYNIIIFLTGIWLIHDVHNKLNIYQILLLPVTCAIIFISTKIYSDIIYISFILIALIICRGKWLRDPL
jgi:low temperature requirement protein LtrA